MAPHRDWIMSEEQLEIEMEQVSAALEADPTNSELKSKMLKLFAELDRIVIKALH